MCALSVIKLFASAWVARGACLFIGFFLSVFAPMRKDDDDDDAVDDVQHSLVWYDIEEKDV
jgi:hypothetical protein